MFKGVCKIIVRDFDSQAVLREATQENVICKSAVEKLLMDNTFVFDDTCKIGLSSSTHNLDYERTNMDNVFAIGDDTLQGVTGRTFYPASGNDPDQVIYHNRFLIPTAVRTANIVCLIPSATSNNNLANTTNNIYAFLKLQVPLVQEINEVVDIFYKVYLDWNTSLTNFPVEFKEALSGIFLRRSSLFTNIYYSANSISNTILSPSNPNPLLRSDSCIPDTLQAVNSGNSGYEITPTLVKNTSLLKLTYNVTINFNNYSIGRHVFGLIYGDLDQPTNTLGPTTRAMRRLKGAAGSKNLSLNSTLTPVYSHSSTSPALFYDANSLATSSWKPSIQTDNSHEGLPTLYTLQVETAGGLGIGSYSLYTTNYSGRPPQLSPSASYWYQTPTPLVSTQAYPGAIAESTPVPFNEKWVYPWQNDTLWLSAYDFDGMATVALWRIFPELSIEDSWDLTVQGVVKINDLAVDPDNNLIYVATEQGLYQINTQTDTVSQLSSDRAKAVDVGYNGAVFAALINGTTGRLASSINASWNDVCTMTGSPVDLDWDRVLFIRCDPNNPNFPLAILEHRLKLSDGMVAANYNNQWYSRLHWWDNTGFYQGTTQEDVTINTSMYLHSSITHPYNSSFVVKDGVWLLPGEIKTAYLDLRYYFTSLNINTIRAWIASDVNNDLFQFFNGDIVVRQDPPSSTQTLAIPTAFSIRACKFNSQINGVGVSDVSLANINLSLVPVNVDNSIDGYVRVVAGGSISAGYTGATFQYIVHAALSVGLFEVAADENTPSVNNYRFYKQLTSHGTYNFSSNKATTSTGYGHERAVRCLGGNTHALSSGGFISFSASKIGRNLGSWENERLARFGLTNDGVTYSLSVNTVYSPFAVCTWGTPLVEDRTDPSFTVRYGWNSSTSQWEQSDTLPGKPLHTATEPLIEGLSLGWTDLNPSNSKNLVPGQFYTFVNLPQSSGFINDGTLGSINFQYRYYLRPTKDNVVISLTVPASPYQYTLPEATTDPLWLTLDSEVPSNLEINIAGYVTPAVIITTGTPAANQVLIANATGGVLTFAAADTGKAVIGSYLYLVKIHSTEVL